MAEAIVDGTGSGYQVAVTSNNEMRTISNISGTFNILDRYMAVESDISDLGSQYHCFENEDGAWYIRVSFASGGNNRISQYRYLAGSYNYIGSWASRTTLSFLIPGSVF